MVATPHDPEPPEVSEPVARRVQILIVQDHPLLASALARVLEGEPDLAVAGVSVSGAEAVEAASQSRPDVALMDFRLPDVTGPVAARMIKNEHADAAIVFHSADQSETALLDAIDAGATCGIQKVHQAAIGAREYSFNSPPSLARLLIVVPSRRIGSPRAAGGRRPQLR